jgi:DNA-directed RNA polymerase subunit N (RpoN/RPB10)
MFFRKTQPVICSVCGKAIASKERRFVDKNRVTKAERHAHVGCQKAEASQ